MRNSGKTREAIFPAKRPLLYYITDRKNLTGGRILDQVRRVVDWGVDFVQIREKDLADGELFELAARAVELVDGSDCRILVNGRADIALAAGAHGVHLPSSGLRPLDLAFWLPRDFLMGVSVHSGREAAHAWAQGVDYLLMGPVFATRSKASYGPPLGLDTLRRACQRLPLPILGLGGIGPKEIDSVLEVGAAGVAGISLFQNHLHRVSRHSVDLL